MGIGMSKKVHLNVFLPSNKTKTNTKNGSHNIMNIHKMSNYHLYQKMWIGINFDQFGLKFHPNFIVIVMHLN